MAGKRFPWRGPLLAVTALLAATQLGPPAPAQVGAKVVPKLEPVAETRLLMEGLAHPNFRALERHLGKKPEDAQTWTFARGQALLIAETANLLMLRPPKNQGQPLWFQHAMDLRTSSTKLAQVIAKQDYKASRVALVDLANICNRCHQSFRVPVEIVPFEEKPPPPGEKSSP